MNLLILDGPPNSRPGYSRIYRGTERAHPSYCDSLPEDHEINRLFYRFLEEGGELGVVHNLSNAVRFAELWNDLLPPERRFEVVDASTGESRPDSNGKFIGFDISHGFNNSLLSSGLRASRLTNELPHPIRELSDLLRRHYAPQLNLQGLFQTFETASLCLRAMIALQDLSPNLFEGTDLM